MSKKFVVGIDDSEDCIRAAEFALVMAADAGASIHIIHVLEWSPYSFLTPQELEERHKRRGEELERANSAIVAPMIQKLESNDCEITGEVRYGGIAETISKFSDSIDASQIFIGRTGDSKLANRLFGSVPGSLVQISKVPVTVVP